jgi:polar amino acid transport system substrate-binding protein
MDRRRKRMKKAALFAIAALALAGALCGPVMGGDTLADVKAKGVLVVGVRDTAPPFGTFNPDKNRYEGYDIDVARYIAEKLGVKVISSG